MKYTIVAHRTLENGNHYIEFKNSQGSGSYRLVTPENFSTKIAPKLKGQALIGFQFESRLNFLDGCGPFNNYFGIPCDNSDR